MTHWLVTMGGARYDETTRELVEQGPKLGAERVLVYDDVWLKGTEWWQLNRWLWNHPGQRFPDGSYGRRGMGWYAWKPFIVLDAIDRFAQPGDVVLYVDGDTKPVADFSVIYRTAERDGAMFFASQGHLQKTWCTRDCYLAMGLAEASVKAKARARLQGESDRLWERFYDAPAGVARFFAIQKGPWKPRQMLLEWLTYSLNPMCTTFDDSELATRAHVDLNEGERLADAFVEHPGFQEHRTEQAIMSLLALKYGYRLHRECDDSGEGWNEDRDIYPQLFQQVRVGDGSASGGSRYRNV